MTGDGPVGIIDIGSNSVRLVVYERLARSPTPFFNEKILAGLGRSVAETGLLADESVRRTVAALKRFRALADQMGVRHLDVLATAAVREASNGPEFIKMAEAVCGVSVRTLTGAEEAHLAGLGVLSGIPHADGLCGDLGGGSLELVGIREGRISEGETFPLGGLRLQHAAGADMKAARRIARSELEASELIGTLKDRELYAIGGTWRSLARLHMENTGYPLHVMRCAIS